LVYLFVFLFILQTCDFQKRLPNTALRVTYQGDLRVISTPIGACRRWYITIGGQECSTPTTIEAVIFEKQPDTLNLHRPATLDGLCYNIPAGRVTVGLSVGKCVDNNPADAATCWGSSCRLIIEEVPLVQ